MLNQRQEDFCTYLVSGMTATDAAIRAGYSSKFARQNCPKLLQNNTIQERIATLRAPTAERASSTKDAKLQVLEKIYTHEPDKDTITGVVVTRAIAEHNKMSGDYAPEKHAVLGDIEITIVHKDKE